MKLKFNKIKFKNQWFNFNTWKTWRETNLKVKQALSEMASQFEMLTKSNDSNAINYEMSKLDCSIECEAPNELLNEFEGF